MNFYIATKTELLKTKRTASFWLSVLGAALIPGIFFLGYTLNPEGAYKSLAAAPWQTHFMQGWQALAAFLFPMFVILICTLIPHIEYRSNSWKQVFASPRSITNIYFSKFVTIHLMIFFFYLLFNALMILSGVFVNLIHSKYTFLDHNIDWRNLLKLNFKIYVSILGISAIMYFIALRFKNFIAPLGIGLALLVGSLIALGFNWEHISKLPFAHPILTLMNMKTGRPLLENHELNSLGYFVLFTLIGFLDMKFKKDKG
jgi:hypothetical protein